MFNSDSDGKMFDANCKRKAIGIGRIVCGEIKLELRRGRTCSHHSLELDSMAIDAHMIDVAEGVCSRPKTDLFFIFISSSILFAFTFYESFMGCCGLFSEFENA